MCIFFFSSRRRHTISKRDWSSDVCSSDLCAAPCAAETVTTSPLRRVPRRVMTVRKRSEVSSVTSCTEMPRSSARTGRSEERRVGKEYGGKREAGKEREKDDLSESECGTEI